MVENPMFDVFLAHNTADKPKVRVIAEKLKRCGLKPWLDEEQIPPGRSFQEEIQKVIPLVQSAAIFIGLEGLGKWQAWELRSLISQCVEEKIPVIPVLLPGVDEIPKRFLFLRELNWVSFEKIDDPEAFDRLVWGITADEKRQQVKPEESPAVTDSLKEKLKDFEFPIVTVDAKGQEVKQEKGQARYFTEELGNGINLEMIAIPGGKFLMGTEAQEIERLVKKFDWYGYRREKPEHEVTVQSFFMGKYPVTQAQWKAVASLPKENGDLEADPSKFKGGNRPVENVSWEDAEEFCQRLSKKTGKEYRLPSEAEWEYACRAGRRTPFHFGETITDKLANYDASETYASELKGEYRKETTAVGQFSSPNDFGLYDMHGNVWEWCQDNWHDNYEDTSSHGIAWVSSNTIKKVRRGGSWSDLPWLCRSAFRSYYRRDICHDTIGFRVLILTDFVGQPL